MRKNIFLIITLSFVSLFTYSQNEMDALRFSYLIPSGTARTQAMGGAFGAFGADATSLTTNPAGMGIYQRSDFTFSPSFTFTNTKTKLYDYSETDFNYNLNLSNISYISPVYNNNDKENHLSVNLGFSYNRMNNFNQSIFIEGRNHDNSITDWFAGRANGIPEKHLLDDDNFYSGLAYWAYLIDPVPGGNNEYTSFFDNRGQKQTEIIENNGSIGEYSFAVAANILHKLHIGASLGIKSIRYSHVSHLSEKDDLDLINDFNSLSFTERFETRGTGLDFKIGALYRPVRWLRVGGAIHTPTFYNLSESYRNSLYASFSESPIADTAIYEFTENSKYGRFEYRMYTPFKATGNLGFFIGNNLIAGIDYEFIDYRRAKISSDSHNFSKENQKIESSFKPTHNFRAGLEYRYNFLSIRGGAAYYDNPFKSNSFNKNAYTLIYSGGIGIRGSGMYFDISYSYITNESDYQIYQGYGIDYPPTARINMNRSRVISTIGFIF